MHPDMSYVLAVREHESTLATERLRAARRPRSWRGR
jgi:hypothetical protein